MRDALNSNPIAQAAIVGALLIATAFFVISSSGGGEDEGSSGAEAPAVAGEAPGTPGLGQPQDTSAVAGAPADVAAGLAASAAPRLPRPVLDAYRSNRTIVLLVVHRGGVDQRLVENATVGLAGFGNATVFVVPARRISRYAAITEGVGVERAPALIVVTPRHAGGGTPTASVSYGFQSPQSVAQAVIDAGYRGPTIEYHP